MSRTTENGVTRYCHGIAHSSGVVSSRGGVVFGQVASRVERARMADPRPCVSERLKRL